MSSQQVKRDTWSYIHGDLKNAAVLFLADFKPHGKKGHEYFFECLRVLSKMPIPSPDHPFNVPPATGRSTPSNEETRYAFKSVADCEEFVRALMSIDLGVVGVENVVFTDPNLSIRRRDNISGKWKMTRGPDGQSTLTTLRKKDDHDNPHDVIVDKAPHKQILERLRDGTRTPIGGPATPVKRLGEDEDESGKKKMRGEENSIDDIMLDADSSEKKIGNEAAAATLPFPSIPSVKEKAAMKLDFPLTLVEATNRVQAIKEAIASRFLEGNSSLESVEEMNKLKRDHSFIAKAIDTFEMISGEFTWEEIVSIYTKKMEKMYE